MPNKKNSPASHSPGPWHRNIRANGKYPVVFSGRNNYIAIVQQQKDGGETEANIDLISSAPDLLAALKDIAEHGRRPLNEGDKRPFAFRHEEMAALAEAAIAKAEAR